MSVLEEKKASTGRFPVEVQEGRDILTREDTDKLFRLLAFYRPNDPHLKDNALRAVWALTLAPYSVDDVREAVVATSGRKNTGLTRPISPPAARSRRGRKHKVCRLQLPVT